MNCDSLTSDWKQAAKAQLKASAGESLVYKVIFGALVFVYFYLSDGRLSLVFTLSSALNALAFMLLRVKVNNEKSVAGISKQMLILQILQGLMRCYVLFSTDGYRPVDFSGQHVYPFAEVLSICLAGATLYPLLFTYNYTYDREADSCMIQPWIALSIVVAIIWHPHLTGFESTDILWMAAGLTETYLMFPQLWMVVKTQKSADGMTAHFIMTFFLSRGLLCYFWYRAYDNLYAFEKNDTVAAYLVLLSHFVQVLLIADFAFQYLKNFQKTFMNLREFGASLLV